MRRAFVVGVAAAAVMAVSGSRARGRRRAGRLVRLAVGQPAAAGEHREGAVVRRGSPATRSVSSARSCATVDGGSSWTGVSSGTFTNLTEVQAIDATSVFAGGGCVGRRSDDGGVTGVRVAFTPVESSCSEPLVAAWWVSKTTAYLVLADGTTLRTDNNGDTFAQKVAVPGTRAAGGGAAVNDIRFTDAEHGRRGDQQRQDLPHDGRRQLVGRGRVDNPRRRTSSSSSTRMNGVAVGDQSLFLATTDGGITWSAKGLTLPAPAEPHGRLLRRPRRPA